MENQYFKREIEKQDFKREYNRINNILATLTIAILTTLLIDIVIVIILIKTNL